MRGKDSDKGQGRCIPEDHPRLCGEKPVDRDVRAGSEGSPPPMRGKGLLCISCVGGFGITPAYAGKSTRSDDTPHDGWDHPRLCGEK